MAGEGGCLKVYQVHEFRQQQEFLYGTVMVVGGGVKVKGPTGRPHAASCLPHPEVASTDYGGGGLLFSEPLVHSLLCLILFSLMII